MPKVSVVIPVFNGARTVARALASVFAQSYRDYDVVAVDDGSTDDTQSVLAGYADRIHVVTQPNRGVSAARNSGARASSGEYLAFLDDDDEWMPEKLARSVPVLDEDPNCALVYTGISKVDQAGRPMPQDSQTDGIDSPSLADMLARPWNVVPSQLIVRRDVFDRCAGFDERLINGEDIFFLLRAREHGYFHYVPELLARKTMRPLYPTALNREQNCEAFIQAVRERYGASAAGLIREFRLKRVKLMKHMAHLLMQEGRPRDARRCLARVIYYQPASPKAYRRYLKTFLPARAPRQTSSTASSTEDSEA
jgi:glycosyltransferase involved in cell wall biosynthesis